MSNVNEPLTVEEQAKLEQLNADNPDRVDTDVKIDWCAERIRDLLSVLCIDTELLAVASNNLTCKNFSDNAFGTVFTALKTHYDLYKTPPADSYLVDTFKKRHEQDKTGESLRVLTELYCILDNRGLIRVNQGNRDSLRDQLIHFVDTTNMKLALIRAADFAKSGDVVKANAVIKDFAPATGNVRSQLLSMEDLETMESPTWLIDQHLPNKAYTCMYGESGKLKSFIALDMALSVAYGTEYISTYDVEPGPVVYIASEGKNGYKHRVNAWKQDRGIKPNSDQFKMICRSFSLVGEDREKEVQALTDIIKSRFPSIKLLVIDTLALNFGGNDENSTKDMNAFNLSCHALKDNLGCTVLAVHHTGKDTSRGARGAYALRCALDTMIEVQGCSNDTGSLVKCVKQKDFAPFDDYILKKNVMPVGKDAKGEVISSLALSLQAKERTGWALLPEDHKQKVESIYGKYKGNTFATRTLQADGVFNSVGTADRWLRKWVRHGLVNKTGEGWTLTANCINLLVR